MFTSPRAALVNPANLCTALRLVLLPLLIRVLAHQRFLAAALLIMLIGLSDLVDGPLARRLGTASRFGALFDVTADCAVVFTLQGYLIAQGTWAVHLLVLSMMSVGSFGICAIVKGRLSKNSLGQYTGAVLLSTILLLTLSRAIHPGLWQATLRAAGPLVAGYLGLTIIENLQGAYRRRKEA